MYVFPVYFKNISFYRMSRWLLLSKSARSECWKIRSIFGRVVTKEKLYCVVAAVT